VETLSPSELWNKSRWMLRMAKEDAAVTPGAYIDVRRSNPSHIMQYTHPCREVSSWSRVRIREIVYICYETVEYFTLCFELQEKHRSSFGKHLLLIESTMPASLEGGSSSEDDSVFTPPSTIPRRSTYSRQHNVTPTPERELSRNLSHFEELHSTTQERSKADQGIRQLYYTQ